ncbi:hypothetical protein AB0G79_09815 [Streptomyces sp. NPDC020807]|uniref:hypothetical protein n=1 Tax=Streptomyces sp. NPDC020807 TaxID=3155119 RepID=UPI0034071B1C
MKRGRATGDNHESDAAAEALRAALRPNEPLGEDGARQAVAAFRAARDAGMHSGPGAPRTRPRDDWRPVEDRSMGRWSKAVLVALVSGMTLGGAAIATDELPTPLTDLLEDRPEPGAGPLPSASPEGAAASTSPEEGTASVPPSEPTPSAVPVRETSVPGPTEPERVPPGAAVSHEALCRAHEQRTGRAGEAPDATALRRLVEAAGGKEAVSAYCEKFTGGSKDRDKTFPAAGDDGQDRGWNRSEGRNDPADRR